MKILSLLIACLALTSCATCREHKMACAATVVAVVVATSMDRGHHHRDYAIGPGPGCYPQPDGSCR